MGQLNEVARFFLDSILHIWPYLLVSIPLAVAVKVSGAARFVTKAFTRKPMVSIILATMIGAFSPFCSCGVIPVISSLLIGGVPLAPVMSFWLASPSMDPEVFFLSTATIGLTLSVWRLVSTFVISLGAGITVHIITRSGLIGQEVLRENQASTVLRPLQFLKLKFTGGLNYTFKSDGKSVKVSHPLHLAGTSASPTTVTCCISVEESMLRQEPELADDDGSCNTCSMHENPPIPFWQRLLTETWNASLLIMKFMTLAIIINALIHFYIPQGFISNLLGGKGVISVLVATLVGIPAYTSNLTALPFIGGLLSMGMNQGAALAFLIAGPTTTISAMVAVWGITKRKVFLLYISFTLAGALLFGMLFNLLN